jgi:hypothetical protein
MSDQFDQRANKIKSPPHRLYFGVLQPALYRRRNDVKLNACHELFLRHTEKVISTENNCP